MTNIFEHSNIFGPNIYSDIRSYQTFDTNIFGYSFMSKIFIRISPNIRSCHFLDTNIFGYSFVSKSIRMSHSDTHPSGKQEAAGGGGGGEGGECMEDELECLRQVCQYEILSSTKINAR